MKVGRSNMRASRRAALVGLAGATLCIGAVAMAQDTPAPAPAPAAPPAQAPEAPLMGAARLRADAEAAGELVSSELAMQFLDSARSVEDIEPRTVFVDPPTRTFYTPEEAAQFDEAKRSGLREIKLTTDRYLGAYYGTPIAYVRAIDLIGSCGVQPAFQAFGGKRIMDFGHGGIGQLRMMASCGADVVGVEVDSFQRVMYREPSDQGPIPGHEGLPGGKVTLVNGQWPADEKVREAVGGGYDLILSKNTLKRGYIHPEREADPKQLVHLGVTDEEFIKAAFDALKPGGLLVIYNLSPAPAKEGEPYKPWADGRCPFTMAKFQQAGFRIVTFDTDDSGAARDMGRALGWDEQGMDLQNDLFATVTMLWKPVPVSGSVAK